MLRGGWLGDLLSGSDERESGGRRRGVRGEPWWIIEGNAPTTIKLQRKSYSLAESLLPERRTAVCLAGCGWLSEEILAFLFYSFHWGKNHQAESHIFHVQLDVSGDTQPPVKLVKKSNVPSPPKGKQGFEEHKFHRGHQTHKEMSVLKLAGVSVSYFFDLCKPHLNLMRTFLFVTACPTSLPLGTSSRGDWRLSFTTPKSDSSFRSCAILLG